MKPIHQYFKIVLYGMQVSLFLSVTLPGSTVCMYVLTYGNYVMHISVCLFSHIDMFNGCCDCVDRDMQSK